MVDWYPADTAHKSLTEIADTAADAVHFGHGERTCQAILELAAAELNRRHGNASIQTYADMLDAPRILNQLDDLYAHYTGDEFLNWARIARDRARAWGVLLDMGTDGIWENVQLDSGMTRKSAMDWLVDMALTEGVHVGHHHVRVALLIPADADELVAPF